MKIKKNVFVVVFTAIVFSVMGSWNAFAQNEPIGIEAKDKGDQIAKRLILQNVSTDTNVIVTIMDKKGKNLEFKATHGEKKGVTFDIPNGFGENGDIFRLKIVDSQGECNEQVKFDWSNKSNVKGQLYCPNLKTRIDYTMKRKVNKNKSDIEIKFTDWKKLRTNE